MGRLFQGYLTVAEKCEHCELDLKASDSGDGPAVFVIFIVGPVVTGLAFWVEAAFEPPFWAHALLWIPAIVGGSMALLRPFKAVMIALQYRHKSGDAGTAKFD